MTEHQIQSAFIEWVRLAEKQDERLKLLFAIPNGGRRDIITAALLKKEGVRPGVPDIFFPFKTEAYNGLAIEFKKPKVGRPSKEQSEYIDLLIKHGWRVEICTDAQQAIEVVKKYLRTVVVRMEYIPLPS